jgi:hypothetical protein
MDLDSSGEDGDIGDGSSFNEHKKKKKTSTQQANFNLTGKVGRALVQPMKVGMAMHSNGCNHHGCKASKCSIHHG